MCWVWVNLCTPISAHPLLGSRLLEKGVAVIHILQRRSQLVLGIHVDRSSLSTNHELALHTKTYYDEVCEASLWLVGRKRLSSTWIHILQTTFAFVFVMVVQEFIRVSIV
jgi:hypothetical protein